MEETHSVTGIKIFLALDDDTDEAVAARIDGLTEKIADLLVAEGFNADEQVTAVITAGTNGADIRAFAGDPLDFFAVIRKDPPAFLLLPGLAEYRADAEGNLAPSSEREA